MKRNGFSLVELSIVLVIIGLLVGGLMAGSSLIRGSEVKTVISEYAKFKDAGLNFRVKYAALPGDLPDALNYWSGVTNGDGDATIDWALTPGGVAEFAQFWLQLEKAGLIEGVFTGTAGATSTSHMIVGTNIPEATLDNAGWGAWTQGTFAGDGTKFAYDYGNVFTLGANSGVSWNYGGSILKPGEAWNLDMKMDDGMPGAGKIIVTNYTACANGTGFTDYAATYRVDSDAFGCSLYFTQVF